MHINFNVNKMNQTLAWNSLFMLSWLILLGQIQITPTSIIFFTLFIAVAIFSGTAETVKEKEKKE